MVINTLNWILFVFLVLLYITVYTTSWVMLNDKTNKDNKGVGLTLIFGGLFAAFAFIPAAEIFNVKTAVIIWKIMALITLTSSVVILFNDRIRQQKSYIWSLLPIILITIAPFIINISITFKTPDNIDFNNIYLVEPVSLISCIIAAISIIALILFMISTSKTRHRIEELSFKLSYFHEKYDDSVYSFRKPYEKLLKEDLYAWINQFESKIAYLLKLKDDKNIKNDINDLITTSEIHDLNKKIDDIRRVMILLGDNLYNKKTVDFDIIRDLNHFFATPFATIEANIALLNNEKGIDHTSLEKISNSIQLCKCIIETYRDCLSFNHTNGNIINSLKNTFKTAFNTYSERNNKSLSPLNTDNIPDSFKSHNNNYIITLIIPLLENAIQAAPNDTEIEISFDSSTDTICISNMCEKIPDLDDLKTPGFSSKDNHTGTGIVIVNNLLSIKNRGSLETTINNNKVTQTIKLN